MNKGKHVSAKRIASKTIALVLALVLIAGGIIGGTIAWLVDDTDPVVNTFTYGDINITLEETDTDLDGDNNPLTNEYEMMPGMEIGKDPKITVKAGSENSWLFVQLEKSANFDSFITYIIGDGWTQLKDETGAAVEGVYFRYHTGTDVDVEVPVLKDNIVQVLGTVTKDMLNELDKDPTNATYPTLTATAYAVQYVGFEPVLADSAAGATDAEIYAAAFKAWGEAINPDNYGIPAAPSNP